MSGRGECYLKNDGCEGRIKQCVECDRWMCTYHWGEGTPHRCTYCRQANFVVGQLLSENTEILYQNHGVNENVSNGGGFIEPSVRFGEPSPSY